MNEIGKEFTNEEWEIFEVKEKISQDTILSFLKLAYPKAFRECELAKELNISKNAVNHHFFELKKKGLVEHKSPYWRFILKEKKEIEGEMGQ